MYLALDLRRTEEKRKPLKSAAIPELLITLFINILQEGKSEAAGAETVQRTEAQILAGTWQVNVTDFIKRLAYPHLNKKAEDTDENYAIHLTFFCIVFNFSAFCGV